MTDQVPYWANEKAFADAVDKATAKATQNVAATNRKRLMVSGGLVGFIAACVVAIPVSIGLTNAALDSKRDNAIVNCRLITKLANVAAAESDEASQSAKAFEKKSSDRFGLSQKDFDKLIKEGQKRRELHLNTIREVAAQSCDY